jgi:hypothetical protein
MALGMADYRCGHFAEAEAALKDAAAKAMIDFDAAPPPRVENDKN